MKSRIFETDGFESAGEQLNRFLNCNSYINVFKVLEENYLSQSDKDKTPKIEKRFILLYDDK